MPSDNPRLRYLEAFPHTHEEKPVIVLRDPLQVSELVMMIPTELYPLLLRLDGEHSVPEIARELSEESGHPFSAAQIQHLVDQFDQAGFLDNQRYRDLFDQAVREFRASPRRKPAHAGLSYPADTMELQDRISSFYTHKDGAGLPGQRSRKVLNGLAAPHIDLRLGGPTYTHAYRALAESAPPDLFIILGTGHHGLPDLFSIARKDFETPLGVAKVDQELLRILDEILGRESFVEDLTHRSEHTIEFQIPFLQHLFPRGGFSILPVLCSFSFHQLRGQDTSPADRQFDRFVEGLQRALKQLGKRVCFISSIDLAHIGPRYGDSETPDTEVIQQTLRLDRAMLEPALSGDPDGFFGFVAEEQDRRRICGFSPLYTMLHLLEGRPGSIAAHQQSQMDPSGSFVSYASLVFRE